MAKVSPKSQSTPRTTPKLTPAEVNGASHRVPSFSIEDLPTALRFVREWERRLGGGEKPTRWEVADLKAFNDFLPLVIDANKKAHAAATAKVPLDVRAGAVAQVGFRVLRLAMRAAGLDPKPLFDPKATGEDRELLWAELDDAAALDEMTPATMPVGMAEVGTAADLCTMAVALKDYHASRATIRRKVKGGTLQDHRPKGAHKNATLLLSRKELGATFPRKS
jgi:hypothetical protein